MSCVKERERERERERLCMELFREESLACQITSPFNDKEGSFLR